MPRCAVWRIRAIRVARRGVALRVAMHGCKRCVRSLCGCPPPHFFALAASGSGTPCGGAMSEPCAAATEQQQRGGSPARGAPRGGPACGRASPCSWRGAPRTGPRWTSRAPVAVDRVHSARRVREQPATPATPDAARLLGLGLVNVLHQHALVLEHVALDLRHRGASDGLGQLRTGSHLRPQPLAAGRAFRYISWYMCLSIFFASRYLGRRRGKRERGFDNPACAGCGARTCAAGGAARACGASTGPWSAGAPRACPCACLSWRAAGSAQRRAHSVQGRARRAR